MFKISIFTFNNVNLQFEIKIVTMVNNIEFSKRIKTIMNYYDLNASSFADKVDVGRASISHVLSGRNKPSLDFVLKIVKQFSEVDLYWLLNGKGQFPDSRLVQDEATSSPLLHHADEEEDTSSQVQDVRSLANAPSTSSKIVKKVIICYNDGTFDSYEPTNS